MPSTVAKTTSSGYGQWMMNLNIDGLNKTDQESMSSFKNLMEDLMLSQADKHIGLLLDAFESPGVMRSLTRRKWAQQNNEQDTLRNMIDAVSGLGIHHPNFMSQLRPMLHNDLLKSGALQFRTVDKALLGKNQKVVGSYGVIAPDITNQIKNNDEMMMSINFPAIKDYIEREVIAQDALRHLESIKAGRVDTGGVPAGEYSIELAKSAYNTLSAEEKAEFLNDAIETGDIKISALTFRTPTLSLGAIAIKDVMRLIPNDGESLYFTGEDVSKRQQGDHDIDKAHVIIVPQSIAEQIKKHVNTRYFQEQQDVTANLDLFESMDSASMADYNGRIYDLSVQAQGSNTQGITTNMKAIATTLAYKFGNITLTDGTIVRAYSPNDIMIMDFAPLKQNRSIEAIEKDLPSFASVVEGNDGKWYLKTTAEHAWTIIINAATDHPKKGLLVNKWGYNGTDWVIDKMFKIVKGPKKLARNHTKPLKELRKMFNYSRILSGEFYDGRPMDMEKFFFHSRKIMEFLEFTAEEQLAAIKDAINETKIVTIGGEKVETTIGIKTMEIKEQYTSQEKLLIRPIQKMLERYGEDTPKYPGWIAPEEHQIIHYLALKEVRNKVLNNLPEYGVTDEAVNAGDKFITNFANTFYDMFYQKKNKKGEYEGAATIDKVKFDEDLWSFVKEAESNLNTLIDIHGPGVSAIATIRFAEGIGGKKNISHFPPIEVMSIPVLKEFLSSWEKYRNDDAQRKNFDLLEEIGRTKFNIVALLKKRGDC